MAEKPTYEKLERKVRHLESELTKYKGQKGASEQKILEDFRGLAERSQDAIYHYDLISPRFLFVNKIALELYGFKKEDGRVPSTKSVFLHIYPEDREKVQKAQRDSFASGCKWGEVEYRFLHADGTIHWMHDRFNVIRDKSGRPIAIEGIVRDNTESKLAEEALRKSEKRMRTITDSLPVLIAQLDMNQKYIFTNKRYEKLFGKTTSECIGKHIREVLGETGYAVVREKVEKAMNGEKVFYEYDLILPNEQVINMFAHYLPSFNEQGEVNSVYVWTQDISERKQIEEALRESEEKYRMVAYATSDIIYEFQIKDEVFTYISPKCEEILGYKAEEIMNTKHFIRKKLILPEDFEKIRRQVTAAFKGSGGKMTIEIPMRCKDGSIKYMFENVTLIRDKNRRVVRTIGSYKDVTEIKQLEARLHRAQKMEAMGLLAGGVAHDLNNVLSGIVSYPELILMDIPEDSKLRKPIETMQESGHRAVAIVQDLLTVARGVATTKEPLNLNGVVTDYLNSPEFKKLKQFHPTITVKTDLDTDLFNIGGTHVHIRKVVMNLVSNAAEAIEGSGNVTISTVNRYIDRPLRGYDDVKIGEYAVLAVSDDGSGISSGDLERIFEPFYTKKVMGRSGTGLGLAVVWNIVQDHKGYMDVITDENGTTFELYFPVTRDEILDKTLSIPIKDYKGNGETILVVDDVESQREISCNMLDTLGYKTKAVSSGEEAVEYLKEHTVDLILLDMIMDPGINGRETYERIIKIHPNQKAIIVSGFSETDKVKETQKLGAGKYIKKPLTLEKIGLAVKGELEK